MATLDQFNGHPAPASSSQPELEPTDRLDNYLGEDLIDSHCLDALESSDASSLGDRLSEVEPQTANRRQLLDYLAGEKYLDELYRDDEGANSTDGEDGAYSSRRSTRKPSIPYVSAPLSGSGHGVTINATDIDATQLSRIVAEEAERKQKARAEKELAWQKVRQLLIEEEEKASTGTVNSIQSVDDKAAAAPVRDDVVGDESYGTVKLLDSLGRSGSGNFSYNRSVSSDVDAAPSWMRHSCSHSFRLRI